MGEIVSKVLISIDYSGGSHQCKKIDDFGVKHAAKLEGVVAIGVQGYAGYKATTGGGDLSIDVFPETGSPEVNYEALFYSEELFTFTTQEIAGGVKGIRHQYRGCRVAAPPDRKIKNGEVMSTVSVLFQQSGIIAVG